MCILMLAIFFVILEIHIHLTDRTGTFILLPRSWHFRSIFSGNELPVINHFEGSVLFGGTEGSPGALSPCAGVRESGEKKGLGSAVAFFSFQRQLFPALVLSPRPPLHQQGLLGGFCVTGTGGSTCRMSEEAGVHCEVCCQR